MSFFCIFYFISISAVLPSSSAIYGHIVNKESKEPIQFANVFLSGTTIGDISDESGYFEIKNIPNGRYELIVSHLGFNTITFSVLFLKSEKVKYKLELVPKVIEFNDITITSNREVEWEENYKIFCKYFLGQSNNSEQCKILNAYVLDFKRNEDTLIAETDSTLFIENIALGYSLDVILKTFICIDKTKSAQFHYNGFFTQKKPKNENEREKWESNRLNSYLGSFRHFISALAKGNSRLEGFVLERLPYYGQIDRYRSYNPMQNPTRIVDHSYLIKSESGGLKQFGFSDYLQIEHRGNKSGLIMSTDYVLIDTLGMIYGNPGFITRCGIWANKGIADVLPLDYKINDKTKNVQN